MSDAQLIVEIITGLQEENQKLKDKLEQIRQIVDEKGYVWSASAYIRIKEILEQE